MFKEPAMFADRKAAGRALASRVQQYLAQRATPAATVITSATGALDKSALRHFRKKTTPVVVSIPRGGIPLARIIAEELDCDFDVCLVRRIPGPTHSQSIAAVTEQGDIILSQPSSWGVSRKYIEQARIRMLDDIRQRRLLYNTKATSLKRREVIIVDDCIASGASMLAALHIIKKQKPSRIVIASPFCSSEALQRLQNKCDEILVLHTPTSFVACAQFYVNFAPVTDLEVMECIRSQKERAYRRYHPEADLPEQGNINVSGLSLSSPTGSEAGNHRMKSRLSSSSWTSSSEGEDPERKDEDLVDDDKASFRAYRAESWANSLLREDENDPTITEGGEDVEAISATVINVGNTPLDDEQTLVEVVAVTD